MSDHDHTPDDSGLGSLEAYLQRHPGKIMPLEPPVSPARVRVNAKQLASGKYQLDATLERDPGSPAGDPASVALDLIAYLLKAREELIAKGWEVV